MSKAVDPFGPEGASGGARPETIEVEKRGVDWQARRDRGVWYAVAGIGLMFAGRISTALSIGGALMVLFGIVEYIRWSLRRPKDQDPWRDEEIDAWESHHYGDEGGLDDQSEADAPDVVDAEPEEALGLHRRF